MKSNEIRNKNTELLCKCILTLQNEEECIELLEDLFTIKELQSISQRVMVAKMLTEKKVYYDIVNETGASTATISRVNRSFYYGKGGYEKAFKRLKEKNEL